MENSNKVKKIEDQKNGKTTYLFNEGIEISIYKNGIFIESTDYHAFPCFINEKQLKKLCLHIDKRKTHKMKNYIKKKIKP